MVKVTETEVDTLLQNAELRFLKKKACMSAPGKIPQEVYFINKGLVRVMVTDLEGVEHTVHFATENQFIADYSSFILKLPSAYTLQAMEDTEVVVLDRAAIEWGYDHMAEGNKLGRLIAEFYFLYHDSRIRNIYERTPAERYRMIDEQFPGIHNRVPQHMIASYLGVTPIHLSRLKKQLRKM